jgi:tRNA dimethylallyltransferase
MGPTRPARPLPRWNRPPHPSEIISVDSALVYRGMDIGTAKPTRKNWPPCRTT